MNSSEVIAGTSVLLAGFLACIGLLSMSRETGKGQRSSIGDVSCAFKLSFSPEGPAFWIWSFIFVSTFLSIVYQFQTSASLETQAAALLPSNLLMGSAWLFAGLWSYFFTRRELAAAAVCLVLVTTLSTTATFLEEGFAVYKGVPHLLLVCLPFSVFAGWTLLAASLSIGIYFKSQQVLLAKADVQIGECKVPQPNYSEEFIPLALALLGIGIAAVRQDAFFVLPVAWGLFWIDRSNFKLQIARALPVLASVGFFGSSAVISVLVWNA
jgi:hypothetical protein